VTRWLIGLGLVVAMVVFGFGVYQTAEHLRASRTEVHKPTEVSAPSLPGTVYVVQAGAIYRLQKGSFKQITDEAGWMQPSAAPNNQLVAIRRQGNYSDMYLLSDSGTTVSQLTHNASKTAVESNHWVFYPRFTPEGNAVFYSFDPKDIYGSYKVDLTIFESPLNSHGRALVWTTPNAYTGGDVSPVPLQGGALIYTKYSIDDASQVHSQIWIQRRAGSAGLALTPAAMGCSQPAVSPDETQIVMVCDRGSNQHADLVVAPLNLDALTIGPPTTLVGEQLVASPVFSPDGKTVAFLAPDTAGGHFQLWAVASSGSSPAKSITSNLDLDSDSAPVWLAG
jgi:Tol biopolymer transport system component